MLLYGRLKHKKVASPNQVGNSLKFLQRKLQLSYMLLLPETGLLPIEVMGMERVTKCMLKVQNNPSCQHPRITQKQIKKTHKNKIWGYGWMQVIKSWFEGWDASHLFYDGLIGSSMNEDSLQCQCFTAWERRGGSCFEHHINTAPSYKHLLWRDKSHSPKTC
mgnify:FL=1